MLILFFTDRYGGTRDWYTGTEEGTRDWYTGTEEGTRGKSMFEMKFMFIAVTV
jgi:hypothetical protein